MKILTSFRELDPLTGKNVDYYLFCVTNTHFRIVRNDSVVIQIIKKGYNYCSEIKTLSTKKYLLLDEIIANKAIDFLSKSCGA